MEIAIDLRHQYLSKIKEKEDMIQLSRAEASMNAKALKRFVEENQKLAQECSILLEMCKERECSPFEHDRELLMEFANEADERAKHAETRNNELLEEKKILTEQLSAIKPT